MRIPGINAVFHDPAAAFVDGETVAAAEEERCTRRKHGKEPVPFSTWELPRQAALWCLRHAGLEPRDLDGVAYSHDPALAQSSNGALTADGWEPLRTLYAARAPHFLRTALPGRRPETVRFLPHQQAHALFGPVSRAEWDPPAGVAKHRVLWRCEPVARAPRHPTVAWSKSRSTTCSRRLASSA